MASALEELLEKNKDSETPVSFYDFYNAYGRDHAKNRKWVDMDPYSFGARFQNWINGTRNSADREYSNYLTSFEEKKNDSKTAAANAVTFDREDTSIPRLVEQYQAAGLNPYAAIAGGGSLVSGASSSQAQFVQYKKSKQDEAVEKQNKAISSAMKILALMVLKSMM